MATEVVSPRWLTTLYGPEAKQTRIEVRRFVEDALDRNLAKREIGSVPTQSRRIMREMSMRSCNGWCENDTQAAAKAQITSLTMSFEKPIGLMFLESEQTSMSCRFWWGTLWLVAIFISFGAFAPATPRYVTLIICAMAVSPRFSSLWRCIRHSVQC